MFGLLVGGNMRPIIIQRSHSGLIQVMQTRDHVRAPWSWENWKDTDDWTILKLFRSSQLEAAIKWAKETGFFAGPASLRETLGSWDRQSFAPNPPPDQHAIDLYRQNLQEQAHAIRPEKPQRGTGKKARRARRALLDDEDQGITTVRTSRL